MKKTNTKQINLSESLRNLKRFELIVITGFKYSVIGSTIQRIQNDEDMRFEMKKNKENKTVTVTKTA